jgi:putative transposase
MITRRVSQRLFLLLPQAFVTRAFEYCLAEAALRHDIQLIAWCAMSNHYHAVVHDPEGKLPAFLEHFHKMLAKTLNVFYGRWENFWSSEETCVTLLVTDEDIFEKVVYVLANPVAAHLVDRVVQWPGASSWGLMGRKAVMRKRPSKYFRKQGSALRDEIKLAAVPPPGLKGMRYVEWIERVRKAVALRERIAADQRKADRRIKLVGRKNVLSANPRSAPKTKTERRKLRPALACKNREAMKTARTELKYFRTAYRTALTEFRAGKRETRFPAGTYRLRILGACCEPSRRAA